MSKGFFNLLHTKIGIYHGPVRDVEISPRVLVKWYVTAKLRLRTPRSMTTSRMMEDCWSLLAGDTAWCLLLEAACPRNTA
jgi:hypothetical protein